MTNIYAHLADGDAPKNQHITEVSFVDETGKHVDIGGGGAAEIHTDSTLTGTGTADSPLKISDTVAADIAKGKEITRDNIKGFEEHGETIPWYAVYVGTFNDNLMVRVSSSLTSFNNNRGIDLSANVKDKINNAVQVSQLSGVTPLVNPGSATTEEIATLLNQLINALKQQSQSATTNTPTLTESI